MKFRIFERRGLLVLFGTLQNDERLITKAQLAERIGVSLRTIEFWMAQRVIPFIKIKKTVRFVPGDVEEALKRNFGIGYGPGAVKGIS